MSKLVCLLLVLTPALASADKTFTKSAKWDCTKDATVSINHGGGSYTFTGACKVINVNGGGVKLTIESVDTLNINGGGSTATVGTADVVNINGAGNKLTWKKAKSGDKPQVNIMGAANKVDQAK